MVFLVVKIGNRKVNVRVFDKDKSVFKPWIEDTKNSLDQAVDIDCS